MLSKLRIVSINDVYELTNLPKLQSFLAQLNRVPNAVILAGDFLSPSPLSSLDGGKGMVATLRAAGSELWLNVLLCDFQVINLTFYHHLTSQILISHSLLSRQSRS
jgi:hypothetical protein